MEAQGVHSCDKCGYSTMQFGHLKAHISAVHEGSKFDCPQCDLTVSFKSDLRRHIKTRHVECFHLRDLKTKDGGSFAREARIGRPSSQS